MAQLDAEGLDLRADRLRHPQSVQRQERDQGVLSGRAEPGGDEERADPRCGPSRWRGIRSRAWAGGTWTAGEWAMRRSSSA
jgi:hypothetical protein